MLITFYADRSRLSHADNSRNNILAIGKGPTNDINDGVGTTEKKNLVLILAKQIQNFAWVCITMVIIVICLLMQNKFISLKPIVKIPLFQPVLHNKHTWKNSCW